MEDMTFRCQVDPDIDHINTWKSMEGTAGLFVVQARSKGVERAISSYLSVKDAQTMAHAILKEWPSEDRAEQCPDPSLAELRLEIELLKEKLRQAERFVPEFAPTAPPQEDIW